MNPGELSYLQPACREAALLSNDERIHWLRQERWIQYPRAERILERLMDLVDYPPRDRMPCLVVYPSQPFRLSILSDGCLIFRKPCFSGSPFCPRRYSRLQAWRLGYAFCPLCIAQQPVVHIRWDWCFACIVRCAIHRTSSLHFGCPGCGEADPLSLGSPLITASELACQSCGHHLGTRIDPPDDPQSEQGIQKVEEAYRAALLGTSPHPALLGKITDRAFRRFVDDMLELLVYYSRPGARMQRLIDHGTTLMPRQHLLALIAGLISNAAPSCEAQQRRFRYSRSLKLWAGRPSPDPG